MCATPACKIDHTSAFIFGEVRPLSSLRDVVAAGGCSTAAAIAGSPSPSGIAPAGAADGAPAFPRLAFRRFGHVGRAPHDQREENMVRAPKLDIAVTEPSAGFFRPTRRLISSASLSSPAMRARSRSIISSRISMRNRASCFSAWAARRRYSSMRASAISARASAWSARLSASSSLPSRLEAPNELADARLPQDPLFRIRPRPSIRHALAWATEKRDMGLLAAGADADGLVASAPEKVDHLSVRFKMEKRGLDAALTCSFLPFDPQVELRPPLVLPFERVSTSTDWACIIARHSVGTHRHLGWWATELWATLGPAE
mmetsp:Transcript_9759/g.25197  ORF Transcript_9759/g.25197 Transcript_9759/m.25197 type:complete len:316 (+) Transcript_9759:26-973(+)